MIKIAITGSHGVGKSTLTSYLQAQLADSGRSVGVVKEIPRFICEKLNEPEFFRAGNNTLLKQTMVLFGQLVEEETSNHFEVLLCDRSLFDHWAYTLYFFEPELKKLQIKDIYESYIAMHASTYSKIFHIPIEFGVVDDGVRESDADFQKEIDVLILRVLSQQGINPEIIRGSVAQRADTIIKYIKSINPQNKPL